MALGKAYTKSVVFISGSPVSEPEADPKLRGTGFLTGFRSEVNPDQGLVYIATAAHVVRPLTASLVKLKRADGSVADHAIDEWFFHPTEDIAVARLPPPYFDYEFMTIEASDYVGAEELEWSPEPGADVYVAGLLRLVPSMGARNIPMVRAGSIGALNVDDIPMRFPDDTLIKAHGHLIDCQSFGGFSGSPCLVRYLSGTGETESMGLRYPIQSTLLLGMVGGHFDLKASITLPDQENKVAVPLAAGVAVVYPAETIKEVLDTDELAAERAELNIQLKAEKEETNSPPPES